MKMKLTKAQKKAILMSLPAEKKMALKHMGQGGGAWADIWANIKKYAGPIAQEVGPVVLKEFVIPAVRAKMGNGKKKCKK